MGKYKGVIFDLDGTLLDSLDDLADSANFVMQSLGFPTHEIETYKYRVGTGIANLIRLSLPDSVCDDGKIHAEALALFKETYAKKYMDKTKPYEGIADMVAAIHAKGIKIAANSNKPDAFSKDLIAHIFPDIPFVAAIGERAGTPIKPDPSAALEIATLMGITPQEVLYIGDSNTDMKTGINAGMETVGVLWGFRDEAELRENGAKYIVRTPQEILKLL